MRTLAVKLGDLDPHADADRWFIWVHAVEEFLWFTSKHDKGQARINLHPMFYSWCSEWGDRLGLIDGILDHIYPACPPLDLIYGKEAVRHSEAGNDEGIAVAAELDRLWKDAWKALLLPAGNEKLPTPQSRHASRGMKFSLLALVLRHGVFDGSPQKDGRSRCVHWRDAVDAASLLLALSLYWRDGNEAYNPSPLPWADVKRLAAEKKLDLLMEDPEELKGHAESEGIEGFRKRLRAIMDEAAFNRVSDLAAKFERRGASGLEKWRNESGLSRWFEVGRA